MTGILKIFRALTLMMLSFIVTCIVTNTVQNYRDTKQWENMMDLKRYINPSPVVRSLESTRSLSDDTAYLRQLQESTSRILNNK